MPRFHFTLKELLTGRTATRRLHDAAAATAAVPVNTLQGSDDATVTATLHKLH